MLSGTPSSKAIGPTEVEVNATLGRHGPVASATIPFTVNAAPTFGKKPVVAAAFTEGTPGSATVTATGSPTPTITEVGNLPNGVSFVNGVLSGTPAVTVNSAVYSLTITASNGIAPAASETFTLTVYAPLAVSVPDQPPSGDRRCRLYPGDLHRHRGRRHLPWKKVSLPKGMVINGSTGRALGNAQGPPAATR